LLYSALAEVLGAVLKLHGGSAESVMSVAKGTSAPSVALQRKSAEFAMSETEYEEAREEGSDIEDVANSPPRPPAGGVGSLGAHSRGCARPSGGG
jgi:hypothetical protein